MNSILKLSAADFPDPLKLAACYQVEKQGYRIIPMDVPILLVDRCWLAQADVIINKLVWEHNSTQIQFQIQRIYTTPFSVKIDK